MSLWLVRHVRPLLASGLCYGALDVAADPDATLQAAHALALALPQGATVRASPLQRCAQLAQALQLLRADLACQPDARLVEMNFGCYEGQRWDGIGAQAYEDWTTDFWQHRFGGVESVAEVMTRVADLWDEAQRQNGHQVWITHAGVIRAAQLLARGVRRIDTAAQWPVDAPAFGQWFRWPQTGQGAGSGR